jgi:hypothetical protein
MLMRKTMQHVLTQRSPRVLHRMVHYSMVGPLLALRGWEQFKLDVVNHPESDEDLLRVFLYEGSFPPLSPPHFSILNCQTPL